MYDSAEPRLSKKRRAPGDEDGTRTPPISHQGANSFARPPAPPGLNGAEPGRPRKPMGGSPPFHPGDMDPQENDQSDQTGDQRDTMRHKGGHDGPDATGAGGMGDGGPGSEDSDLLHRRQGGDPLGGFPELQTSVNEPGGGKPAPEESAQPDVRQIAQTIRSRGPEIQALVQRRRAQTRERFNRFGNTPTGGDENAPRPKLRRGRRAFNGYDGNYS